MNIELRELQSFIVAAKTLNFSEAAKQMCVTQSSFSQIIKQLEEKLRVPLFYRNSHQVTLTDAGMELIPFARNTLQQAENCQNRIDDLLEMRCGTLNIGVTHSFNQVVSETLLKFSNEYPQIKLNIHYETMDELMLMLSNRSIDFVLSYKPVRNYPKIESHVLFDDRLSVVLRPDHPLANKKKVSLYELEPFNLVLPSHGLQARNLLEDLLANNNHIDLKVRVELNSVSSLLGLVRNGNMITVLSGTSVETCPELKAIPLDESGAEMQGSIHMLKDAYQKVSAKKFIKMLCETNLIKQRLKFWF